MRQTTLDEPQTTEDILLAISRLGWDRVGERRSGLTTLYTLRRYHAERELSAEELPVFLANGAPEKDVVTMDAVWDVLRRTGPIKRGRLKAILTRDYDVTRLVAVLKESFSLGDLTEEAGVVSIAEPEL